MQRRLKSLWCIHWEFSYESIGERILEIDPHLPKLLSNTRTQSPCAVSAPTIMHRHSPIYLSPHTGGPKAGRGSRPSLKNCYFWLVWTTTTTNKLVLRPFLHDDPRVTDLWAGARTISHSGSWCGLQELLLNLPPHPVPILSSSPVADM